MNIQKKWDEICFLLSDNINQNLSERDFENQVVRAIEVLGWREFKNEIERQPTIQLGREGTLRPDLIIYGNDKKSLINGGRSCRMCIANAFSARTSPISSPISNGLIIMIMPTLMNPDMMRPVVLHLTGIVIKMEFLRLSR